MRLLVFYNTQTIHLTFVGNYEIALKKYSIEWFQIVSDIKYNIECSCLKNWNILK